MSPGSSTTQVLIFSRGGLNAHVPHEGAAWCNSQNYKDTSPEQINRLSDNDSGGLES